MVAGEKDRLLKAAQSEQNPELRAEAVRQLGAWARTRSCGSSIRRRSSVDVKKQIIRAMFVGGNADRLIELAKTEQNPELRRDAVRNLGVMGIEAHRRRAGRDLRQRQGSRHPQGGHQRAVPPGERRRRSSRSRARSRT